MLCYSHGPHRIKLNNRAIKGVFVGYSSTLLVLKRGTSVLILQPGNMMS